MLTQSVHACICIRGTGMITLFMPVSASKECDGRNVVGARFVGFIGSEIQSFVEICYTGVL